MEGIFAKKKKKRDPEIYGKSQAGSKCTGEIPISRNSTQFPEFPFFFKSLSFSPPSSPPAPGYCSPERGRRASYPGP